MSGTGAQARVKDLVVYASGDRRAYRRVVPVLEAFARAQYYVGAFGAGSKMKFVANLLVAMHNVAAAEAIVLGMKAGLDPAMVLEGHRRRRRQLAHVPGARPDDGEGRLLRGDDEARVWQKDMTIIGDFVRSSVAGRRCSPRPVRSTLLHARWGGEGGHGGGVQGARGDGGSRQRFQGAKFKVGVGCELSCEPYFVLHGCVSASTTPL